jgi:hypothetical protein
MRDIRLLSTIVQQVDSVQGNEWAPNVIKLRKRALVEQAQRAISRPSERLFRDFRTQAGDLVSTCVEPVETYAALLDRRHLT